MKHLLGFDEKDTAATLTQAVNDFNETQKATRDRVDISLKEYKEMEAENMELHWKLCEAQDKIEDYEKILRSINFPIDRPGVVLFYNTSEVEEHYNPMSMKKQYRITVDVDAAVFKEARGFK